MPAVKKIRRCFRWAPGSIAIWAALVVMTFLTLIAFLLDVAGGIMRRNLLQTMADQGTDAGMAALSDLIIEKARARNPNAPDGTDPRTVLTDEDRQAILIEGRNRIEPVALEYIEKNRAPYQLTLDPTEIQYPITAEIDCAQPGKKNAELRVTVKTTQPMLFESLWNKNEWALQAQAWQTMSLCP